MIDLTEKERAFLVLHEAMQKRMREILVQNGTLPEGASAQEYYGALCHAVAQDN